MVQLHPGPAGPELLLPDQAAAPSLLPASPDGEKAPEEKTTKAENTVRKQNYVLKCSAHLQKRSIKSVMKEVKKC